MFIGGREIKALKIMTGGTASETFIYDQDDKPLGCIAGLRWEVKCGGSVSVSVGTQKMKRGQPVIKDGAPQLTYAVVTDIPVIIIDARWDRESLLFTVKEQFDKFKSSLSREIFIK